MTNARNSVWITKTKNTTKKQKSENKNEIVTKNEFILCIFLLGPDADAMLTILPFFASNGIKALHTSNFKPKEK